MKIGLGIVNARGLLNLNILSQEDINSKLQNIINEEVFIYYNNLAINGYLISFTDDLIEINTVEETFFIDRYKIFAIKVEL